MPPRTPRTSPSQGSSTVMPLDLDLVLILPTARILGLLARRSGTPSVVVEIVAGMH